MIETICFACGMKHDIEQNCPWCDEEETLNRIGMNNMITRLLSCEICDEVFETSSENEDCPHCKARQEGVTLMDLTTENDAKAAANALWFLSDQYHVTLVMTSHYMLFTHYIWSFINDVTKGVFKNTRVKSEEKIKYLSDFFLYAALTSEAMEDLVNNHKEMNKKFRNFSITDRKDLGKQENLLHYYTQLTSDKDQTKRILGQLIWIHRKFQEVIDAFLHLDESKASDSQKLLIMEKSVKSFVNLKLLKI